MTPLRWAAVTAGCAALFAGVVLAAGTAAVRPGEPAAAALEQRIEHASWLASRANYRMERAATRDSLRGVLRGREWPAESLLIVVGPRLPAWRAAVSTARARTSWTSAGPKLGSVRVAFVALSAKFGISATNVLLPDAVDGRTCVVVHELGPSSLTPASRKQDEGDTIIVAPGDGRPDVNAFRRRWQDGGLLGACAFYAAFGVPGPKVRAWLDDVEFYQASASNFWSGPDVMPPWYASRWTGTAPTTFNDRVGQYLMRMLVTPNGPEDAAASRCASGRTHECAAVSLSAPGFTRPDRDPPEPGMPLSPPYHFFGYVSDRAYRDFRPRLLADMVRDVGVDRFRQIWTSTKSIDAAYADVTGTPFETAMLAYVRRSVGGGTSIGPSLPARPVATALVIVAILLISVSARLARREHR